MKKWEILNKKLKIKSKKLDTDELVRILLENRGIKTKKEVEEFLNPEIESLTAENLGIDKRELGKSLKRIKKAIVEKEQIVIFGDYDADGICGTAVLWETLDELKARVMPYIPHRIEEGYGLSLKGIKNLKLKYKNCSLIITVDNGIVANKAVEFANAQGIDVIITDHHTPARKLPKAHAIIHSTLICGAGVAWFLAKQIINNKLNLKSEIEDERLGLAAIATVTDVMKLQGFNRTLLILGLEQIRKTKRPGILAIVKSAAIDQTKIGVYELGHVIGPRLNATGRLEHAMDSLRLICTKDPKRAEALARKLSDTNLERQKLTIESFLHAKSLIGEKIKKKLLFVSHESYEPGVIGLVAGKLVEEFYRPSIVLSIGKEYSKASARSISGFNIIEFIRLSSSLLVDAGGHPMAAGFTLETKNIDKLKSAMEKLVEKKLGDELLVRKLRIDCELDLSLIDQELFDSLQKLSPFGPGNPEPIFLAKGVVIENMQMVGQDGKHLRLELRSKNHESRMRGILFGYDQSLNLAIGDKVDVVYTISQNEWLARRNNSEGGNRNKRLELKIKDLRKIN